MSEKTSESLGQFLRSEREKRNISVEQLAYATRIGLRMLRALENDHYDDLPAQAFVRGYLQAYGKYLGLDVQDLLLRYQHHLAISPHSGRVNIQSHYLYVKERYQERRQLFLVIALFVALLGCAGTYFLLKSKREQNKNAKAIALKVPEPGPVVVAPQQPAPTATHSAAKLATPTATHSPTEADENKVPTKIYHPSTKTKFTLVLHANDEAWIRYQMDDENIREITLKTGQDLTIKADKVFKLFSGRMANLTATLNGQEVKNLIQPGRAMSAVLPESEITNYSLPLFPPLPKPSASPTDAPQPEAKEKETSKN